MTNLRIWVSRDTLDLANYFRPLNCYSEALKFYTAGTVYPKRHTFRHVPVSEIDFLCQI